jgi:hypothetical protein
VPALGLALGLVLFCCGLVLLSWLLLEAEVAAEAAAEDVEAAGTAEGSDLRGKSEVGAGDAGGVSDLDGSDTAAAEEREGDGGGVRLVAEEAAVAAEAVEGALESAVGCLDDDTMASRSDTHKPHPQVSAQIFQRKRKR